MLPSFDDYHYKSCLSLHEWKNNIKSVFKYTNLYWLSKYDDLLQDIYTSYNDEIPFHNHIHVYDVFQLGVSFLTRNMNILNKLSDLQKFTFCLALLCHDINHKGMTNLEIANNLLLQDEDEDENMLTIRSSSYTSLSSICSSSSYNEIHHIISSDNIFSKHEIDYDKELFAKLISYTDLDRHNDFLDKIQYINVYGSQEYKNENILVLFMKLADIGHILRPWEIHKNFVTSLNNERKVPLSTDVLPSDTIWFNNYFVLPLIEEIKGINIGLHIKLKKLYNVNIDIWNTM